MRFIRGAITVGADVPEEISDKTKTLLTEIQARNGLQTEEIRAILFSTTQDIHSAYPAKAARECGFESASLFSCAEPQIDGALALCIRVLMIAEGSEAEKHVYLGQAAGLRKDISEKLIVALDGPAGSGKSTIAKALAKSYNILYLDTGAMYRACALKLLKEGIAVEDEKSARAVIDGIDLDVRYEDGVQHTYLDGEDVSARIRVNAISQMASIVSSYGFVREKMVALQRNIAGKMPCVLDGRDIGTVVLPNAPFKFFLTASVEVRTKRRYEELLAKGQSDIDYERLKKEIEERDFRDSHRTVSPLKQASDAVLIDTSDLSVEEVISLVRKKIQEKI